MIVAPTQEDKCHTREPPCVGEFEILKINEVNFGRILCIFFVFELFRSPKEQCRTVPSVVNLFTLVSEALEEKNDKYYASL